MKAASSGVVLTTTHALEQQMTVRRPYTVPLLCLASVSTFNQNEFKSFIALVDVQGLS